MPTPLPVIGGVYMSIVHGTADSVPVSNIFVWQKAGVPTGDPADTANAQAVSNEVSNHWPGVQQYLHQVYVPTETATYALGSPLVPAQIAPITPAAGDLGPEHFKQIAALVKHTVIRRGKGSQSRTFLSPLSSADITINGDQVTTTWRGNVQVAFDSFVAATISGLAVTSPGTWTYVQLSKKLSRTFPIAASLVETKVSSQRRRLPR
jgi:hypothetical protein